MFQDRKKLRRVFIICLLAMIASSAVTMLSLLVFQYFTIEIPTVFRVMDNDNILIYNFVISHLFAGAVIFAMLAPLKTYSFSIDKMTTLKFVKYTVVTFGVSYTLNLFTQFIVIPIMNNISKVDTNPLELVINDQSMGSLILFIAILAPIAEELIFRQVILSKLLIIGQKNAIILQGVLFGLFHQNLYQFFYTTGIGIVLGYITVRFGSVKYAVYIHMILNFVGSVVALLALESNGAMLAIALFMIGSIGFALFNLISKRNTVGFSDENAVRGNMGYVLSSPIVIVILLYLVANTVYSVL